MALTGLVPVRVTAASGSIEPGTLLGLSDRPGLAARAVPVTLGPKTLYPYGSIIGRALETLATAEGTIRVRLVRP